MKQAGAQRINVRARIGSLPMASTVTAMPPLRQGGAGIPLASARAFGITAIGFAPLWLSQMINNGLGPIIQKLMMAGPIN